MRCSLWVLALTTIACASHAAPPSTVLPPASATRLAAGARAQPHFGGVDYTFTLDAGITHIATRACLHGAAPPALVAGDADSARYMSGARLLTPTGSRALAVKNGVIDLRAAPNDACLAYEVDMVAATNGDRWWLGARSGPSVIASIVLFLWRPHVAAGELHGTARFVLPQDMQLSVAWPKEGDSYLLDPSAFQFDGHVVFGRFDALQVQAPSALLEVAVLQGMPAQTRPWIVSWLQAASSAVGAQIGRFPVPHAQIIIVPVFRPGMHFGFGDTGRSGGVSIAFFMPADVSEQALRDDWVAVHEFCHLTLPYVDRNDAWLSEGMATYLQEVARARAGLISAQAAWQSIYDGSQYGREAIDTLAAETRNMPVLHNYKRVYWGGAILMLSADVELRRRTQGKVSLFDVLAQLSAEPKEILRYYRAVDLLARMDAIAGVPVFSETAARYLNAPKFPDLDELYPALGLVPEGAGLRVLAQAPLAWARDAIMARGPVATSVALAGGG